MARVVLIGIDGLDADLLRIYGPSLPHLRLLMLESPFLELQPPCPCQVRTAWANLYDGETFWDIAEQAGKRVCVLHPSSGVGWSVTKRRDQHKGERYMLPAIFKRRFMWSMRRACAELQARMVQQAEQALEFCQREPWDIFFWQTDTLHALQQHICWYSEADEMVHPERNKHIHHLLDFYRLFDTIIGQFRAEMEKESVFIVVSSYGQTRCCPGDSQLRKWLCTQQLLPIPAKLMQLVGSRSELQVAEGVFLLGNLPPGMAIVESVREPGVKDVAPTVLALLGITGVEGIGRSRHDGEACILPLLTPVPMLMQ